MGYVSAVRKGNEVIVWERINGKRSTRSFLAPWEFFIEDPNGEYVSMHNQRLAKVEFSSGYEFNQAKRSLSDQGFTIYESDIPAELKVLSREYYGKPAPAINVTFYDIEVDYIPSIGHVSIDNPYAPINAVTLYHYHSKRVVVIAVPPKSEKNLQLGYASDDFIARVGEHVEIPQGMNIEILLVRDELTLLKIFLEEISDSDVISGWNSSFFDTPYVTKRVEMALGKAGLRQLCFPEAELPKWRAVEKFNTQMQTVDLSGRASLDYLELFQKYEMEERHSYKLEVIAEEILPELPKLDYVGSLHSLYNNDFAYFIRYNIRDAEILGGFEDKLGYVDLANNMCHLSTGTFAHVLGTLKLAELAIINYCHHELGVRVNNNDISGDSTSVQGAYVLQPKVGMHEMVGSVDINSLYPAMIRSLNISPDTTIGQFPLNTTASDEIENGTDVELTIVYEDNTTETMTAKQWRTALWDRKWAVSGCGTVFTQERQGVIPSILKSWYGMRKDFQRQKGEAASKAAALVAKYKDGDRCSTPMREGVNVTEADAELYDKYKAEEEYYDKLQYCYKIKLNSLYGALLNQYFRFYDLRHGESTTACGRKVLRHQCATVNQVLVGQYDLHGDAVIYGDTDSEIGSTVHVTNWGDQTVEDLFLLGGRFHKEGDKEYSVPTNLSALTYNQETGEAMFGEVEYIYRHKVSKERWRVEDEAGNVIEITGDHSVMVERDGVLVEVKPRDILDTDLLVTVSVTENS